jgi:UDP-glucose 4-epimerase
MESIIISGPTGAIGMALIERCIDAKIEVLAICRKDAKGIEAIPTSEYVKIVQCNLDELEHYTNAKNYDVFYHFAWDGTIGFSRNDLSIQLKNIQYTLDAVQLAHRLGCHTFIGAGSQAEYGRVGSTIDASTPPFPENAYGIAKLCAGQMSRLLCRQIEMKHIWARIFSVYGPYDDDNTMIMSIIRQLQRGEDPSCTLGKQIWDYLYSEDAARAMLLMGEKGIDGKTYCLGSGEALPLCQYIDMIRNVINPNAEINFGAIPYGENQVMNLSADISELKRDLEFEPQVDFETGIKRILASLEDSKEK